MHVRPYCEFRDCALLAERVQDDGLALCSGHRKQMHRRGRLSEIQTPLSPEEVALRAGSAWLEADGEDDYKRARLLFLGMTQRWLRSLGWRPPVPQKSTGTPCLVVQLVLPLKPRRPQTVHVQEEVDHG
jgi:hypothetical protein